MEQYYLQTYRNESSINKKTHTNKNFMSKHKFDLVFITMFNFFSLKLASMQALFHSCQTLPNVFSQMMHFCKYV
jgi:hypothetical protein